MTDQTQILKPNLVKQLYFYLIIAVSLVFFCTGLFVSSKALLTKFAFPKAMSSYYGGYMPTPELQCQNGGGNQYYSLPYIPMKPNDTSYTPPVPTEKQIQECVIATKIGMEEEKERNYQSDMLFGVLTLVIAGLVGSAHLYFRNFFLGKE